MAGGKQKLTARAAANTKPGRYDDGAGLYLVVSPSGARKWAGNVTKAGLGSADLVSLAEARDKAHEARTLSTRRHEAGRPDVRRAALLLITTSVADLSHCSKKQLAITPIGRAFLQ